MSKTTLCCCLLLAASLSAANAATPPKQPGIAYVGDWLTVGWAAYLPPDALGNCCDDANTAGTVTLQQQIVEAIAQKPTIIHIMVGSDNADADSTSTFAITIPNFETELSEAIAQVQAAHIQPILGIEPAQLNFNPKVLLQLDSVVSSMGAKYGIPVINYNGAFNGAPGNTAGTAEAFQFAGAIYGGLVAAPQGVNIPTPGALGPGNPYTPLTPTYAGYQVMTTMLLSEIQTMGSQPVSLYLQNEEQANPTNGGGPLPNVNTVSPGVTVAFYPVVSYANGATQPMLNCDFATGLNGAWTSSNPLVGFINQSGQFWALNEGTATIKFTLPNGVEHQWIMYVKQGTA